MERLSDVIQRLRLALRTHPQRGLIYEAALLVVACHGPQRHRCRDIPFAEHPLHVGYLLAKCEAPGEVIIAGLLHDIVEDTATTFNEVEHAFGKRVAWIVEWVTVYGETWEHRKQEKLQRIRRATDQGVLMVFCADLISNLQLLLDDIAAVGASKAWAVLGASQERVLQYYRDCICALQDGMRTQQGMCLLNELESSFRALTMH